MLQFDSRSLFRPLVPLLSVFPGLAFPAFAEVWRSPLHDQTYLRIEKRVEASAQFDGTVESAPLPAGLLTRLGDSTVEYESFVAAYIPASEAQALADELAVDGWLFQLGINRRVALPWHDFEAGDLKNRAADFSTSGITARPLPALYLLQFAFPIWRSGSTR